MLLALRDRFVDLNRCLAQGRMDEEQYYAWALGLSGDQERARRAAKRAALAEARGMSPAEAADVAMSTLRGEDRVRVGPPLALRLVRDAGVHSVVCAVLVGGLALGYRWDLNFAIAARFTGFLFVIGLVQAIRGWDSPFRLALPGIVLNLAAVVLWVQPRT